MPQIAELDTTPEVKAYYRPTIQDIRVGMRVLMDFKIFEQAIQEKRRKWIDFYRHYYNVRQYQKPAGFANTPVPLASEAVDTLHADIMDKIFSPDGVRIDVMGREQFDFEQAKTIGDLIKYQVYEDSIKQKFSETTHTALVCGSAPYKVCYSERYETLPTSEDIIDPITNRVIASRMVPQETLVYKGPTMIPIDIFDFFPHPQMTDINDDLPVVHRFYANKEHLEEMQKQEIYKNVQYIDFKNQSIASEGDIDQYKRERRELAGVKDSFSTKQYVECYEWQGMFDLEGNGERVNAVLVVTANNIVLRAEELPYYDRKKTYELIRIFPIQGELWGCGVIEKQHPMIHAANSLFNCILDSLYQNVDPPTIVADNAFIDESELVNRSGQIIHVQKNAGDNLQTDFIYKMPPGMVAPDAYNVLSMVRDFAQSASSVRELMKGHVPQSKQTATAVSTAFTQAAVLFKSVLSMIEDTGLIPLCDRMQRINQQFIDAPYAIRVIGANGIYWKQIAPADIAGRVNFISLGSAREADKAMNIQQSLTAINIAAGNPMLQATIPILFMAYAEEANLPQKEMLKILLQWEQQRMQFLQKLQMQVMQGQAQQGIMPQLPETTTRGIQPQNMPQPTTQEDLLRSMRESTRMQPGEAIAV